MNKDARNAKAKEAQARYVELMDVADHVESNEVAQYLYDVAHRWEDWAWQLRQDQSSQLARPTNGEAKVIAIGHYQWLATSPDGERTEMFTTEDEAHDWYSYWESSRNVLASLHAKYGDPCTDDRCPTYEHWHDRDWSWSDDRGNQT